MQQKIKDILLEHSTVPILFIGAGISRRYIGLENWEGLLRIMANKSITSDYAYDMYMQKAKNIGFDIGSYQKVAELIGNDLIEKWYTDDEFKDVREEYKEDIKSGTSPLKIEIAKYIKDNSNHILDSIREEVDLLKEVSKKSIAGVITTNYDLLLENIIKDYKVFVGQEELIFSQLQGIGEIYKIHGCCTKPKSIVIDEEDYKKFNSNNQYLAAKILTLFLEHPIIFIGYSISDENIKNILKDIVRCLSDENLSKLKRRLIFIEWDSTGSDEGISTHSILFDDDKSKDKKSIEMTKIKINDYKILYRAMLENKSKYSAPILRNLKQDIYDLVLTNEPTTKMKVVGLEDDDNIDKIECVLGVGIISELGKKGYESFKAEEIYKDVVLDNKDLDKDSVVLSTLPDLLKQHSKSIPIYKYINESTIELPSIVAESVKTEFDQFLNKTLKQRRQTLNLDCTINELLKAYGDMKCLEYISLLKVEKIDVNELKEFLIDILNRYPNLLTTEGTQTDRTNLKRLIRIYDWLVYYQK